MSLTVTHAKVSAIADDPAASAAGEVLPSDWNAAHTVSIGSLLDGDGTQVLVTKNTHAHNADNGDLRIAAHAYDVNPISGRWNQAYRFGYNMAESGIGYVAGEPSMGIHWESFYEQGGAELLEWHQSVFDTSNNEVRFESWAIDRSTYGVSKLSKFDEWAWYAADDSVLAQWQLSGGEFLCYFPDTRNSALVFEKNNYAPLRQRNAGDTAYLNLPYISSDDRLYCGTPGVFVGATPTSGSYANSFLWVQATSAPNNGAVLSVVGPSMGSAALNAITMSASVGWELTAQLYNTNSSGTCARFMADVLAGSCDPISLYRIVDAGVNWCSGIDNSDSDSFVVAKNHIPGTNNALRIDTSLNSRFYGNLGIANATNGQACEIKTLTELLTIAAAATSTTTIQMPANSIILAVPVRVTTAVTCTSTFTVGDAGSATRFSTAAVSKAANSTDKGTAAGAYYNATARGIVITPDTTPSDATGRVRVTIYYIECTPPTS